MRVALGRAAFRGGVATEGIARPTGLLAELDGTDLPELAAVWSSLAERLEEWGLPAMTAGLRGLRLCYQGDWAGAGASLQRVAFLAPSCPQHALSLR